MEYLKNEFGTLTPCDCNNCNRADADVAGYDQLPCGQYRCPLEVALARETESREYWEE